MVGFPPDLQDIAQSAIDCVADVATGSATKAKILKKLADKGKDAYNGPRKLDHEIC
jgi:hypothetical protein